MMFFFNVLISGEHSVSYICSRFYRAPELMLGATEYTTSIDIWSMGCVLGELLLGKPLFAGDTSVDQLVKIIQILGTPSRSQMKSMNPNYTEFRFPDVRPKDWSSVFSAGNNSNVTDDALDLLDLLLKYEPGERLAAYESLGHRFFDPLRQQGFQTPEGNSFPSIFDFTEDEIRCMSQKTRAKVIPEWVRNDSREHHQQPTELLEQQSSIQTFRQIMSTGPPTSNLTDSMNPFETVVGINSLAQPLFQQHHQTATQQHQHNHPQQQQPFWR